VAAAALGDPGGVLIGDDTGKGGSRSAGVQRQYTGTAGKITNCQLGVFLAYASVKGRALIDRELYLPRSWTGDQERWAAVKVPERTAFATKPQLLQAMIERAVAAGSPFGWVTADEAYGDNGPLRVPRGTQPRLRPRGRPRPRHHHARGPAPRRRPGRQAAERGLAAAQLGGRRQGQPLLRLGRDRHEPAGDLPARPPLGFSAVRAGLLPLPHPQQVPLGRLVKVAGARWAVEECFGRQERDRAGPPPGKAAPPRDQQHARHWSRWRHGHQERARRYHYQRQRLQDH
jgi:hypothetical protein